MTRFAFLKDKISVRSIAVSVAVVTLICAAPVVKAAYGSVPLILTYNSSETTGATTTAITITQEAISSSRGFSGTSLDDVLTQTDLIAYASTLMKQDEHIQSISLMEHSVSMRYQSVMYIQNFGERNIIRTVTITDTGSVSVTKPWYASLVNSSNYTDPALGFRDLLKAKKGTDFSSQTQAHLLMRMQGRFEIGAI